MVLFPLKLFIPDSVLNLSTMFDLVGRDFAHKSFRRKILLIELALGTFKLPLEFICPQVMRPRRGVCGNIVFKADAILDKK